MLFVWPRQAGDWGNGLEAARDCIGHAAGAIAETQNVIIVAADFECEQSIREHSALRSSKTNQYIHRQPANDVWIRDFGPLTILNNGPRQFLDCRFNGWAGKYPAEFDDQITQSLTRAQALGNGQYERRDYVLEGGALESNGQGTLLVTRHCLLDCARNRDDSEAIWNERFREDLGAHTVHWLDNGLLEGDDTDGHVDTLARFVAPDCIVYQSCSDTDDVHFQALQALGRELETFSIRDGKPYRLVALPLPQALYDDEDGHRLPAGYANFLIANDVVLVPQYDDPADATARRLIQNCFPDRNAVGIDCRPLIRQNGAIHCAAMQIPAVED